MLSTSGRSSRSTLMFTNSSFITAATVGSSNDSCAITWHQWHAEYPTDSSTGLSSAAARSNASSDHGYQSTGFSWCCRRYGLVSSASRFMGSFYPSSPFFADPWGLCPHRSAKKGADPGCGDLRRVDDLVVVEVLHVPAERLQNRPPFGVALALATRRVPFRSVRFQVDHLVDVRQIEFGDRHAIDL